MYIDLLKQLMVGLSLMMNSELASCLHLLTTADVR